MKQLIVPVVHGAALDRPDEADTITTAESVAASLRRLGHATQIVHVAPDLAALDILARQKPDVVFNLVEALGGKASEAVRAISRYEALGLAYTGVRAAAYAMSNSKLDTKARLVRHHLPTPVHWKEHDDIPADAIVIIKSVDEHGSLGMDQRSVVKGAQANAEITCREHEFGGRFFAESYIDGREFNVSVLETRNGPSVLPLAEIDFTGLPRGRHAIVDFSAKWDPSDIAYQVTPRRFGLDTGAPALAAQIRHLSLACWRAFALTGYARVDFRVDATGRPYVLEVNANPCLAPDAGFAAAAAEAEYAYDDLIAAIVASALAPARQVA